MADVKSLVKALKDMAVTQYGKGAPYRNALASALKGDMGGFQELNKPSPVMPNEALDVAMTFAPMGITAYHGSPFKFDKFDLNKAKEGTGVNLFGKGVYLTDNPNVAKHYAGDKGYVYKVDVPDKNVESMIPYMEKIKNQNTKVQELAIQGARFKTSRQSSAPTSLKCSGG